MNLKVGSRISINWAHVAAVLTLVVAGVGQYVQSGSLDLTKLGPWGALAATLIALLARSIVVTPAPDTQ